MTTVSDSKAVTLKEVYKRLADRRFASRFSAVPQDGSRPIVVTMTSETVDTLLARVDAVGGTANVACRVFDGLTIFAARRLPTGPGREVPATQHIDASTTVGVLLAHMMECSTDGSGGTYRVIGASAGAGEVSHPSMVGAA